MRNDEQAYHHSVQDDDGRFPFHTFRGSFIGLSEAEEEDVGYMCQGEASHLSPEVVAYTHVVAQGGEAHGQHYWPSGKAQGTEGEEGQRER